MKVITPKDFSALCNGSLRQLGDIRYSFLSTGWLAFEGLAGWTNTRGCRDGQSTLEFLELHSELMTSIKGVGEDASACSCIEVNPGLRSRLLGLNSIHPECVDTRLARWLLLPHVEGDRLWMAPLELINTHDWIAAMMTRNGVTSNDA